MEDVDGARPLREAGPGEAPVGLAPPQADVRRQREDRGLLREEVEIAGGAGLVRRPDLLDRGERPPDDVLGIHRGEAYQAGPAPGTIQLLLGRHGGRDHYLGGRYRSPDRPRGVRSLAFPLSARTVHLFERLTPSQLRVPVPPRHLFPVLLTRYERTAALFAHQVESAGGKTYNAESRPSPEADRLYAELHDAALRADLDLFRRPTWEAYLATAEVEARFGALRESLIEDNMAHFAALGHDVVARLGRMHSRARRLARRGLAVHARTGAGSFFPEQVLKRRALFGLPIREEDRMRAYVDRFLRLVPAWGANGGRGPALPPRTALLALRGERLATLCERFDAAARASRSLPELADLLRILEAA